MKVAQAILLGFVFLLAGLAWVMDLPLGGLLSDLLVRLPMNGILVLSMLPMYNAPGWASSVQHPWRSSPGFWACVWP